jgi:hypothetical protein
MFTFQGVHVNYYLEASNNIEHAVPLNFQVTTTPLAKGRENENIKRLVAK